MKKKIFIPEYMESFQCIASECKDSCCSGWDINIDESTYEKYENSTGKLKELVKDKYFLNTREHDYFNHGFMILKDKNRCPFLNDNLLCDIHSNCSSEYTSATCKAYPRIYNIVDGVYEKSAICSCEEVCRLALTNKEKIEFIEIEEVIAEDIFIKRIIDTESCDEDSLLQYFWDIRVITINILQNKKFLIEERLNMIKNLYKEIDNLYEDFDFEKIDDLLEEFNYELIDKKYLSYKETPESKEFCEFLCSSNIIKEIKSINLKACIEKYKNTIINQKDIDNSNYKEEINNYTYILENYLVNEVFKELIPFNNSESLEESINRLIYIYKVIKIYILGVAIYNERTLKEEDILDVIQGFSKEFNHNNKFRNMILDSIT